jgi:3-dehydroquinate synthase
MMTMANMSKSQTLTKKPERVRVGLGKRSYDIVLHPGGLDRLGQYLQDLGFSGKVGIVTNPIIQGLYGRTVERSLKKAGFQLQIISVPDGEQAKTLRWISHILDQLMAQRFERQSVLVALGGGVIGDMTGFAASVYQRGMPFVQVATTLVAQVDSSVGGKTGVNHPLGKNMIGAFYQPSLVLLDTQTLHTLPKREWIAGLAEVVKYGMIADQKFFGFLESRIDDIVNMEEQSLHHVVKRCCEIKASVVSKDEREAGLRRILNYGHTIGHALESLGQYKRYIHGEAVGIGMVHEADLANALGLCAEKVVARQRVLVHRAGLPTNLPPLNFVDLWSAMLHDKKVARGRVYCVLPKAVGKVTVDPLDQKAVKSWFRQLEKRSA